MVTAPLNVCTTTFRNFVLIGDAAHSIVNHMAQGKATAIEVRTFLVKTIGEAVNGDMTVAETVELYEQERMPKAYDKHQVHFSMATIWQLPDGPEQRARNKPCHSSRKNILARSPKFTITQQSWLVFAGTSMFG